MQFTIAEAVLVEGIVEQGGSKFYCPAAGDITPLLDQMGVFAKGTGKDPYQRSMAALLEMMAKALVDAREAGQGGIIVMKLYWDVNVGHWGVEGQHKCPGRCSAVMAPLYWMLK